MDTTACSPKKISMSALSLRCPHCRTAFTKDLFAHAPIYCPQCRIAVPAEAVDSPASAPLEWLRQHGRWLVLAFLLIAMLGSAAWWVRKELYAGRLKDLLRSVDVT